MNSHHSPAITGAGDNNHSCGCDFSLAYNNSSLSDRVLHIEIVDPPSSNSSSDIERVDSSNGDDWPKNWKRRRLDNQQEYGENSPDVVRVETVHISSAILAARSSFFHKLFLNGMTESQQRHATLRISSYEELAFTELLKFIYGKNLSSTSAPALLDILMVADKYEVSSCKWCCCQLLRNLPMSPESALLYLELPSSLSMATPVLDLIKLAKQFLIDRYKDMAKSVKELMELPLVGIEAVLSSDDLQVKSENMVYDFVLQWALTHCQNIEERRDILATRLIPLVRFPYMTCHKLKMILTSSDLDHEILSKLVLEALFFKSETPYKKSILATEQPSGKTLRGFVERSYILRPIKVVELLHPRQHCVVYLDLKRKECINLFPSGWARSDAFALATQSFYLSYGCKKDEPTSTFSFGLCLGMLKMGLASVQVEYEFAAWTKLNHSYIWKFKATSVLVGGAPAMGQLNLFSMPWDSFVQEDSVYFINDILHLRAEVTIKG